MPRSLASAAAGFNRERPELLHKFRRFPYIGAEWAYHHHGLRWLNENVKNYIRRRDIVDVGASIGDSLAVFVDYTDRRVVCYELDRVIAEKASQNARAAKLSSKKYLYVAAGISDVSVNGAVRISTVDEEAVKLNLTVGLIKADVEGGEGKVVLGALETIKRDQPVLAMSIYHNVELIDLPEMIAGLGYRLRFQFGQYMWHAHWETFCIGIPKGLAAQAEEEIEELKRSAKCHEYDTEKPVSKRR
jgi:hypothetical protein